MIRAPLHAVRDLSLRNSPALLFSLRRVASRPDDRDTRLSALEPSIEDVEDDFKPKKPDLSKPPGWRAKEAKPMITKTERRFLEGENELLEMHPMQRAPGPGVTTFP